MAAVRHLEFAKIAVLAKWPISACDLSSLFQISLWSANMAPRYSQITIFNMASVRHLEFAKLPILKKNPWWELRYTSACQIWSKSDNYRLRYGDKAIFKMAAVRHVEFAKIAVWSRDLYRHVILHLRSKFRIDRSIWRWDITKKLFFQYGVRPPSWICYDVIILHPKTVFHVPNFVLNFHGVRFRNFWNILYFMFQHFGLKSPISGLILTIFGEI